jgi:repressor LexA
MAASPQHIAKGQHRREQMLDFIRAYRGSHGYSPTMQEIADSLGMSGLNGVARHLKLLEAAGRIRTTAHIPRSIVLLDEA